MLLIEVDYFELIDLLTILEQKLHHLQKQEKAVALLGISPLAAIVFM
jgi:hypothetical protein